MAEIVITPGSADANSYNTTAGVELLLSYRNYTAAWDNLSNLPDGRNWETVGSAGFGDTRISVSKGVGHLTEGTLIRFANHEQLYTVDATVYQGRGTLDVLEPFVTSIPVGTDVERITTNPKEQMVLWATELLDQSFDPKGSITYQHQALRYPRQGLVDRDRRTIDPYVIPEPVLRAHAELSLELARRDRLAEPKILGQGLSRSKVDTLEVDIDPSQRIGAIPDSVIAIMAEVGAEVLPSAVKGTKIIRTVR
jgi:hypothetical protein